MAVLRQSREDTPGCEKVSIVLEIQGSARERRKVRWMLKETLGAVQPLSCGSYMEQTAKGIRSFHWGRR